MRNKAPDQKERSMSLADVAADFGKGLFAGVAGTRSQTR